MVKKLTCIMLALMLLAACAQQDNTRYVYASVKDVQDLLGDKYLYPDLVLFPDISKYIVTYYVTTDPPKSGSADEMLVSTGYEINLELDKDIIGSYGEARLRCVFDEKELEHDAYMLEQMTVLSEGRFRASTRVVYHAVYANNDKKLETGLGDLFYSYVTVGGIRYSLELLRFFPYSTEEDCLEIARTYFTNLLESSGY